MYSVIFPYLFLDKISFLEVSRKGKHVLLPFEKLRTFLRTLLSDRAEHPEGEKRAVNLYTAKLHYYRDKDETIQFFEGTVLDNQIAKQSIKMGPSYSDISGNTRNSPSHW